MPTAQSFSTQVYQLGGRGGRGNDVTRDITC